MRFYSTAFLVSVSQGASVMKALEEVYGSVPEVDQVLPWSQRPGGQSRRRDVIHPEAYRAVRTPDNCSYPIEVVILQDCTASFADDIVMMDRQLDLMTAALSETHPNSSFGLISFRDKPQWSLGSPSDYCHRFESALSENVTHLKDAYKRLTSVGGGDPAENQYGAIVAAAGTSLAGWSYNPLVTRLIVVVTDAYPHFADDGMNEYKMGSFAVGNDAYRNDEDRCMNEYYPSPQDVREALLFREAYLAQLVFGSDWNDSLVRRAWEWLNRFIGQTSHFLEPLAEDSSNFWDALARIVANIEGAECQDLRSTTPTPTTVIPSSEEKTTTVSRNTDTPSTSVISSTFNSPSSTTTLLSTAQSFSSTTPFKQSTNLPTTSSAISSTLKSTAATSIEPSTPSTIPISTTAPSTVPISTTPPSTVPISTTAPSTVPISTTPPSTVPISSTPPSTVPISTTPPSTVPVSTTPPSTVPVSSTPPSTVPVSTTPPSTVPVSSTPPSTAPKSTTPPSTVPISSTPPSTAPISTTTPSGTPVSSTSSTAPLSSTSSSEQTPACECCEGCPCGCDEVVIRVAHRPQLLQLVIENDI